MRSDEDFDQVVRYYLNIFQAAYNFGRGMMYEDANLCIAMIQSNFNIPHEPNDPAYRQARHLFFENNHIDGRIRPGYFDKDTGGGIRVIKSGYPFS